MSQNDNLLKQKGLPVLTDKERKDLRKEWQDATWDDMKSSLGNFNKYIMLRPTGFGKTYTCACATNLDCCKNKKVIFVYKSEILKITFDTYKNKTFKNGKPIIHDKLPNGDDRIIYETYSMIGKYWGDQSYLDGTHVKSHFKLSEVGLIIFDECQYMGAETYRKALDFALPYIGQNIRTDDDNSEITNINRKYNIPIIGATATVERPDVDICDKFFTYDIGNGN